jgi:hypothetical protein
MPSSNKAPSLPNRDNEWLVPYDVVELDGVLEFSPIVDVAKPSRRAAPVGEVTWVTEFADLATFRRGSILKFEKITDEERQRILTFARRYGPLELDVDGLPEGREPIHLVASYRPRIAYERMLANRPEPLPRSEPVDDWVRYSLQARAMLEAAQVIEDAGRSVANVDLQSALSHLWGHLKPLNLSAFEFDGDEFIGIRQPRTIDTWRQSIAEAVQHWLDWGSVRATFHWPDDAGPRVDWASDTLFGALALQLSLAVNRCDRFAMCSACGRPYPTSRRPQIGRDNYCPDVACKNVCQARYQRRRRDSLRVARELAV